MRKQERRRSYVLILFAFSVYVLFPSQNSSFDAYGSAAELRYHWDFFEPHHLLHNALVYLLSYPILALFPSMDVLSLAKFWNAVFSGLSLFVLDALLLRLQPHKKDRFLFLGLVAFSFGVWRFSTEYEYYLLPILFSLLGSLFFLRFLRAGKRQALVFSGLFAAVACLFHQVHVFWWLGLAFGAFFHRRNTVSLILFCLPALVVPLAYVFVLASTGVALGPDTLFAFVFRAYMGDSAPVAFGLRNFFFFGVAIWRTFLQLYPSMLVLFQKSVLYLAPVLLLFAFVIVVFQALRRRELLARSPVGAEERFFSRTHLLVLFLHLGFALFSMGNSEFMVMVPFLLALLFFLRFEFSRRVLVWALSLFLAWNFSLGIFPLYHYPMTDADVLADRIHARPDAFFIVRNAEVSVVYAYRYGRERPERIIAEEQASNATIDSLLQLGHPVFTNALKAPRIISRGSFAGTPAGRNVLGGYKPIVVDSIPTFYGMSYLTELKPETRGR